MVDPPLLCLRGQLVVVGKSPDGDSIRFIPDTPALVRRLRDADRADASADGSFQLRVDGVDAPETHYGNLAQPLGDEARDELLAWCGFSDVRWSGGQVTASTPDRIPAAVLSAIVDPNGRPVVLLFVGDELPPDGALTPVTPELVERSANATLAASGAAYATLYESTPATTRDALRAHALAARAAGLGVWARDATASFELRSQASIGPAGSLILPKLFRRCSDYLRSGMTGETLPEWLRRQRTGRDPQDDQVIIGGATVHLSELVRQDGRRISLTGDPLDMVFLD